MGTQVGTPAWIPESVEDQVDVAKIWFVIIKRSGGKNAVSRAALIGTNIESETDKHKGQAAPSPSQQSAVVLGTPGENFFLLCLKPFSSVMRFERNPVLMGSLDWLDGLFCHRKLCLILCAAET